MPAPDTFTEFMRRIRAGDEQAAAELVRQYEPLVRRAVRLRLEDERLCRVFDSMDICQSVLASFFVRTAAGQYDLQEPGQLLSLLVRMARNKLASAARSQGRQRRDHRRVAAGADDLDQVADDEASPSQVVAGQELLARFRQGLTDEERQLADLRSQGMAWADIAARMGGAAQARRMQLARAVERVARTLGLDEESDE
jgi:RNA polymerase sigma-70 factor (ECF subfamily)